MAGSYFELLTEQQGIPAKPFSPAEELRRLRRRLTSRMQTSESPMAEVVGLSPVQAEIVQAEIGTKDVALLPSSETVPPETESASLEAVAEKAGEMKKTLAIWQRSRLRKKPVCGGIFRGGRKSLSKRKNPSSAARCLTVPQEKTLETASAGLMALGIIGVVFGVLSFFRGLEGDLSLGSLVCTTGIAIVAIGLGGRFLASRSEHS